MDGIQCVSYFTSPKDTEEGEGIPHLGKKDWLSNRWVTEDINKISCDHQSVFCLFIIHPLTFLFSDNQTMHAYPSTDKVGLDIGPLFVFAEVVDPDRRSWRDRRMLKTIELIMMRGTHGSFIGGKDTNICPFDD